MYEGFDNWTPSGVASFFTGQVGSAGTGIWSVTLIPSFPAGTLGGKAMNCGNTSSFNYNIGAASTNTMIIGLRYNSNSGTAQVLQFLDSAAAVQCGITISSGHLIFWRGTTATVLGTGTATISTSADNYIEAKIPFGNSVNVEIRVNGVTDISLTGVDTTNTANQNWQYFAQAGTPGGSLVLYDYIYLLDNSGSAPFNDFLGIVRVETLFPTSANGTPQWTPNTSTNVSRVQETAVDSDTSYNSSLTAGNIDTFNHGSLSSTPVSIFAAKVQSFARKEDVTIHTVRNKLISNVTTANGTTRGVSTVYQLQEDYFLTDPDTAAAWASASAINNTKIGYELVS